MCGSVEHTSRPKQTLLQSFSPLLKSLESHHVMLIEHSMAKRRKISRVPLHDICGWVYFQSNSWNRLLVWEEFLTVGLLNHWPNTRWGTFRRYTEWVTILATWIDEKKGFLGFSSRCIFLKCWPSPSRVAEKIAQHKALRETLQYMSRSVRYRLPDSRLAPLRRTRLWENTVDKTTQASALNIHPGLLSHARAHGFLFPAKSYTYRWHSLYLCAGLPARARQNP